MSMFLGPIHYMMFNKIKIAADRSRAIIEAFNKKFGADADEAIKGALPDGPVNFGDAPLEDILGDNPIHQFLQGLIDKVETSEAALVTALLYRFPDESRELLAEAFRNHGAETASKSSVNGGGAGLQDIGNALGQFYLEGMPCDQVSSFSMESDNSMQVGHSDCLHNSKWESVGAPSDIMCELLDEWVVGFAQAMNSNATLVRDSSMVKGGSGCTCKIGV